MKKFIYSTMLIGLAMAGLVSCDPQDNDDHSLGGTSVNAAALAVTANVSTDETGQPNLVTITNASQAQDGVRYYISTDGKSLKETPAGQSISQLIKKQGDYTVQLYAFSACDQQMVTTNFSIASNWKDPNAADEPEGWMGFTAGTDLLADWEPEYSYWFSPSDWSGGLNPNLDGDIHSGLTFTIPEGMGGDQWQGQVHIQQNGPTLSAGKNYDFSIAIIAGTGNIKATVKPQKDGDDNTYLTADQFPLHEGLNVIALSDVKGFDGQFKLALDFGGAPAGTEFTIARVFLSEHNDANIPPFDFNDGKNILKDQPFGADFRFWFSPSDWSGGLNPEHEGDSPELFKLTIPEGMGGDQWQGQVHIPFDGVTLSANKKYNFSMVVIADQDAPGITVKPQNDNDDNTYLSADRHAVTANVPTAIVLKGCPGFDGKFRLCLDFGGTPVGTNITIVDMYLAEE